MATKQFTKQQNEYYSKIYFDELIKIDSRKARNIIQKLDYKNDHELLYMIALSYLDEAIFLNVKKETFKPKLDKHKIYYAKFYIEKSLQINPNCIRAIWVYAKVHEKNNYPKTAIFLYKKIIAFSISKAIHEYCLTDKATVLMIINDARFELYRLYSHENPKLSEKYLLQYKKELEKGTTTIYKPLNKFLLKAI